MTKNDDMGLPDPPGGYGWYFGPKLETSRSAMLIGYGMKCFGHVTKMRQYTFSTKGTMGEFVDVGEFATTREAALALFAALGLEAP